MGRGAEEQLSHGGVRVPLATPWFGTAQVPNLTSLGSLVKMAARFQCFAADCDAQAALVGVFLLRTRV